MTTTVTSTARAGRAFGVVVNGPEGEPTDWLSIDWRQVEDDVRPQDGGHRRSDRAAGNGEGRSGRLPAARLGPLDGSARQAGVYPKGRGKAAPARNPCSA